MRRGLTLLELILVLALVGAFLAISWPAVEGPLQSVRLRRAADKVRAAWMEARLSAMTRGEMFAFYYEADGGRYWIAPLFDANGAAVSATAQAAAGPSANDLSTSENQLPEGTFFVTARVAQVDADRGAPASLLPVGAQQPLICFCPDGTSADASVTLGDRYDRMLTVFLRGLTGATTVGEITPAGAATAHSDARERTP